MNEFDQNFGNLLNEYHKNIIYTIKKKNEPKIIHNHVPVRFIVNNCEYCKKYGNVFSLQN